MFRDMLRDAKNVLLSFAIGMFWWFFLFGESLDKDADSRYSGTCVLLLIPVGIGIPVLTGLFCQEVFFLNLIQTILMGFVTHLFAGLFSIYLMRDEFSCTFLPFTYTRCGKVYQYYP